MGSFDSQTPATSTNTFFAAGQSFAGNYKFIEPTGSD